MVCRWRSWFLEGRQNVHDDERSGRPVTATDNAAVAAVRNVVEADRRVTIDGIMIRLPPGIEIGRFSIGTIMSDVLNFRKVCARWVPRLLSENHKQQRMEAARAFLEMHRRDGDQLFFRIVTGDESWVHHSTTETKRQTWCGRSLRKVHQKRRRYCEEVLTKLRAAIKRKRLGLLSRKVLLVHDNARPHAARTTQTLLENLKWEIFTHPPYSPDLAPSDFHLFPVIKTNDGAPIVCVEHAIKAFAMEMGEIKRYALWCTNEFIATLKEDEKNAWLALIDVVKNLLGNNKLPNYARIVENLISKFHKLECITNLKFHLMDSHLNFFSDNLGAVCEEQGERFQQDIKIIEQRYNGLWNQHMVADYCWNLMRDDEQNIIDFTEKSLNP
ncbi:hypothetical protein LAZ67_2005882 [Cordylochernes scorpioides]|uniref:Histone-lysine N-methyltransferase SETMAR n=1 Tax=Cordylochernes scorpioides TaxID=51811 RepID=A0ABY6K4T8_9ARAC|nr:hypothetical protein LAZ67_2005882 [Cordylochernes scorpioides]